MADKITDEALVACGCDTDRHARTPTFTTGATA